MLNVAIMLILLEAEKLCVILDVIRFFVLLCACTDYYDHYDHYNDGNFLYNSLIRLLDLEDYTITANVHSIIEFAECSECLTHLLDFFTLTSLLVAI